MSHTPMTDPFHSPGVMAATELQQLVATLLVLLSILTVHIDRSLGLQGKEGSGNSATSLLKELLMERAEASSIIEPSDKLEAVNSTLKWCKATNRKHTLACSSLELASDWPTFCAKLLGLA